MKKIIILSIFLLTCNRIYVAVAQQKTDTTVSKKQELQEAMQHLEKSKASTGTIVTGMKKVVQQKNFLRPKTIYVHDTAWLAQDTILVLTPVDSAKIAEIYKENEEVKRTKVGRIIYNLSRKKNKSK